MQYDKFKRKTTYVLIKQNCSKIKSVNKNDYKYMIFQFSFFAFDQYSLKSHGKNEIVFGKLSKRYAKSNTVVRSTERKCAFRLL